MRAAGGVPLAAGAATAGVAPDSAPHTPRRTWPSPGSRGRKRGSARGLRVQGVPLTTRRSPAERAPPAHAVQSLDRQHLRRVAEDRRFGRGSSEAQTCAGAVSPLAGGDTVSGAGRCPAWPREVNHEAMPSLSVRGRPRRVRAPRSGISVLAARVAALALFGHLLVVAHAASHLAPSGPNSASPHCVLCSVGEHSAGIPTAAIASSPRVATWVLALASPPVAPSLRAAGAVPARGPPLPTLLAIG